MLPACSQSNQAVLNKNTTTAAKLNLKQNSDENSDNWKSFKSSQFKLEFDYPENWRIEEYDFGMLCISLPEGLVSSDVYFDLCLFTHENKTDDSPEFNDAIQFTKDYYKDASFYETLSEGEMNLQNIKVYSGVYTKIGGGRTKLQQVGFINNNQINGIRFYADKDIFDKYSSVFEKIMNSIRLID